MKRALQTAGLIALLAASVCFLAAAKAAADFSDAEQERARAENSIASDIAGIRVAVQSRLEKFDSVLGKAETSLDSLNDALQAHKRLTDNLDAALNDKEKGIRPTLQNANAFLVQMGLTGGELTQASIEEHQSLAENNKKFAATLEEAKGFIVDARKAINDPAIHEGFASTASSMKQIDQTIYELRHPPKQARGEKALKFVLQVILGNSIQGAVRR